jgi:5'(3')-deoxyribonucleotidase
MPTSDAVDDNVALIDIDGTLADYDGEMSRRMKLLASPGEKCYDGIYEDDELLPFVKERRRLIKSQPGYWRNLPRLEFGFQVLGVIREVGFQLNILSKGPRKISEAWKEKFEWCQENVPDAAITLTQNKSLTYGRLLFDDFPDYFMPWLRVRPRGLVISVVQPWNANINHPSFIRYDGSNLSQVANLITDCYYRKPGTPFC